MARKLFTAGCVVLMALGLLHLLAHSMMQANEGQNETEKQMLSLMRGHSQDMGLGFVRSMKDIVNGFSLTFSILPFAMGLVGFVVRRHATTAPGLLRQTAVAYAGTYGIMTAVALRYWFPAPLFLLAAAFLCFMAAAAIAPRS